MTDTTPFYVDRAKTGRANCKGCKTNCPEGELRIAKLVASPYGDNQQMKSWHHVSCFMNVLLKQRPTTKRIDSIDDIGNWSSLSKEDQESLLKEINDMEKLYADKHAGKYTAKVINNVSCLSSDDTATPKNQPINKTVKINEDDMFLLFYDLCMKITKVDAYTEKTAIVNEFFRKGSKGDTFNGDLALWCKLLLPQVTKRTYNLKSKQLIKLFSKIFNTDQDDMLTHLEKGDVADTITHFFLMSKTYQPASNSTLTIHDVENFLEDLSKLTKEDEQTYHFKKIIKKCTFNDIKMIIRLIKGDLRITAGPKHILEGIHPDAYNVFQTSRDLNMVLDKVLSDSSGVQHKDATQKTVEAELILMTPVLPMLAEACKSVEMAMNKCPNGIFSEIKYDGERVQVHKKGNEFKYFSRALKPVMPHKVSHFKDYLPKAFPKGVDLVLDAEVLMVDVNTGKPLPFGTLGVHKQSEFKDAQVCLFVFDCLYYNGEILMGYPIKKRRKFLHENMVEVKNHIMFSEQKLIKQPSDLAKMIAEVLQLGLEGLVLKDIESIYEPGKRHWLKVKKDYLFNGAMADTADLVVLGAWFGTGRKGGMMSVFLMGCLDSRRDRWVTVTKVHIGHDDSTLEKLQKELSPLMRKISRDSNKVPEWLDCNNSLVPDFVAINPKKQPVWEITGTEFTKSNIHTAHGISVRFPRVTRIRDDKDWKTATNLKELENLFKTSKEKTDVSLLDKLAATANVQSPKKKTDSSHSNSSSLDVTIAANAEVGTSPLNKIEMDKDQKTSRKTQKTDRKRKRSCSFSSNSTSKEKTDVSLLDKLAATANDQSPKKKTDSSHSNSSSLDITFEAKAEVRTSPLNKIEMDEDPNTSRKTQKTDRKRKRSCSSSTSKEKTDVSLLDKLAATANDQSPKKKTDSSHSNYSSLDVTIEAKAEVGTSPLNKIEMDEDQKTSRKTQKTDRKRKRSCSSSSNSTIITSPLKTKKIKKEETPSKTKAVRKEHKKIRRWSSSSSDATIDTSFKSKAGPSNNNKKDPKNTNKISLSDCFESDSESDNDEKTRDIWNKFLADNPLPDVFLGKKLGFYPDFISFTEEERDCFERHWIAYGGIVVKSIRSTDVDYVVHTEGSIEFNKMQKLVSKLGPEVRHVNKYWLIKCISEVCLFDTKKYTVVVKASS